MNGPIDSDADPDADDAALARALGAAGESGAVTAAQLKDLMVLAGRSAQAAGTRAVTSGRWFADITLAAAEHLPVRDLATLRQHHDGLLGPLLAGSLVRNASLATAAVGAATGALAAVSETTPATWVTLPIELAAETLVVVAIEMKLVGELHEAALVPLPSDLRAKGTIIARAWADSRGIRPQDALALVRAGSSPAMVGAAADLLGRSARDQLANQIRRRIVARVGRHLSSLLPFLIGAAAGAALNRRATRVLGTKVAASLGIEPPRR